MSQPDFPQSERLPGCMVTCALLALWALLLCAAAVACGASQPSVCSLTMGDMQAAQTLDLTAVSRTGVCDAYDTLEHCPEARTVNAKWSRAWDQWETQCHR